MNVSKLLMDFLLHVFVVMDWSLVASLSKWKMDSNTCSNAKWSAFCFKFYYELVCDFAQDTTASMSDPYGQERTCSPIFLELYRPQVV